jgi:rhodanese-related sulfurtransferase
MNYEITPEEVKSKLESGEDFTLLDCREPWEYQTARIDRAVNIPMGEIPARVQELDPDEPIVVVCHHGVRSLNVTAWLRQQGFEKVQSLAGGIDRWSRTVDPKVPIY